MKRNGIKIYKQETRNHQKKNPIKAVNYNMQYSLNSMRLI